MTIETIKGSGQSGSSDLIGYTLNNTLDSIPQIRFLRSRKQMWLNVSPG
jgi:hypothetical protein